jgi:hypothetical protein
MATKQRLAKSVADSGTKVLDDPILSSDEDYRAFFNSRVLEELLKLGMQVIVLTADDLEVAFVRADELIRGGHTDSQKQAGGVIRDAAERFCKEMLVRDRRAKGDGAASRNDYDNRNLGYLSPLVEPLLTDDPSHPGNAHQSAR